METEKYFAYIAQTAKKVFEQDGYHMPMLFADLAHLGITPILMAADNKGSEQAMLKELGGTLRAMGCTRYFAVVESWMASSENGFSADEAKEIIRKGDHEGHKEVLLVVGVDRDAGAMVGYWNIVKDVDGKARCDTFERVPESILFSQYTGLIETKIKKESLKHAV